MREQKKDIVKSIVVLVVICLVTSAALAIVNSFTAPVSAANATERENAARRAVIPDAADFKTVDLALPDGVVSAYDGVDAGGETLGYVFTVEGKGFDGTISVMCAIGTDGKILRALDDPIHHTGGKKKEASPSTEAIAVKPAVTPEAATCERPACCRR